MGYRAVPAPARSRLAAACAVWLIAAGCGVPGYGENGAGGGAAVVGADSAADTDGRSWWAGGEGDETVLFPVRAGDWGVCLSAAGWGNRGSSAHRFEVWAETGGDRRILATGVAGSWSGAVPLSTAAGGVVVEVFAPRTLRWSVMLKDPASGPCPAA